MANNPQVDISHVKGTYLEPPAGLDPDSLLFLGDPERKTYSPMTRAWMPVSCAVALGLASVISNLAAKMPVTAGVQKHVFQILLGFSIGEGAYRLRERYCSERDLQYYHYMVLHPEDFQAPERKTYGQILWPWIPLR